MNKPRKNARVVLGLVALVAFMGAGSFAAVPFYNWFCRVTGYAGTTSTATAGADTVLDRTIRIRFDASLEAGMPWSFRPMQREVELKIGETGIAYYEAHNPLDVPVAGSASYNVVPYSAGGYFMKIACFCFTEQVLQPGETVRMPVTYYVDPEIVNDIEAKYVREITLSYTFHRDALPKPEETSALQPTPSSNNTTGLN
ncbi:cytochrome c oxidase assembly protein (plasmid) [Paroceanicella profunda]|uniref:Cytochrome c oxidase assembly protein CtaG n=1 Tax=Paroceanicella profunda TaxID=2579971 RepID=A0A5B8FIU3_9RHOB|nr:cytochrome c oxidase assembly protein [Paroceanicella profunda]QDL94191.1 cytochrome c oxidase assembly protein [Paroceanicella profunda]